MKTKIDIATNPFGIHPKGIVFQTVMSSFDNKSKLSLLDFGCRNGDFLYEIDKTGLFEFTYGVDLDKSAIDIAKLRGTKSLFEHIKKNHKFDSVYENWFDIVTVIGVIEHIHDQDSVIVELARLLKPKGLMIVAVPGRHVFSFLDMGNWKFKFPKIHKFFVRFSMSESEYQYRYVSNEYGCIGDIEAEKAYHEHFSLDSLTTLLNKTQKFEILEVDGTGFFYRILVNIQYFLPKVLKGVLARLIEWDFKWGNQAELVFTLRKID
jgi:SAM-dependent methyltransferase